ncbi:DUF1800 domain-containing protein [Hymenobacter taeanensis]|uniref:DUF1800 domain-containing protein n=1 Tax=Hymenobacter taeanensis TaxID=2735321 RepID=A0A6M6BCP9_9BACT|nr:MULTISPECIES: DUF1800 domain-containing protein [Hymenobacter]QJX46241.1 DUF1800 domain-containing protein [Hymenobacter taeanensis]UOQ80094.1 DUF1800 domain-containing protein [Hymenobacter sp. 5414T-23]
MTSQQQLQHLYWRAGFGPRPQDVKAGSSPRKVWHQLLQNSQVFEPLTGPAPPPNEPQLVMSAAPAAGTPQSSMITTPDQTQRQGMIPAAGGAAQMQAGSVGQMRRRELTPAQRKQRNLEIRSAFYAMNTGWLNRMATSPAQLREKLTFFWHGHFACRVRQPEAALQLNNTIRRLALGKFSELLLAVSQEAAMLQFLNNQQNRKQRPNENFAREVMELFTLGRGHYTEQDVKEAARAFTGWGADAQNRFVFRAKLHDDGPKTFLGHTGNFGGEDILRIILEQPQTAEFITTKLYRFFVNDTPNPAHIKLLAQEFYKSQYNISGLLERIFLADWFYAAPNVGTRIKSPVELLAGMKRTFGVQLADDRPLVVFQKALGQTLFQPPNVAGWPGGRSWIDSSSLLYRLQLPSVLFKNAEFRVALKDDENDIAPQLSRADRTFQQSVQTTVKLAPVRELLAQTPAPQQAAQLADFVLQTPIRPDSLALVQTAAASAPDESRLRTLVTALLSLPEYQLM